MLLFKYNIITHSCLYSAKWTKLLFHSMREKRGISQKEIRHVSFSGNVHTLVGEIYVHERFQFSMTNRIVRVWATGIFQYTGMTGSSWTLVRPPWTKEGALENLAILKWSDSCSFGWVQSSRESKEGSTEKAAEKANFQLTHFYTRGLSGKPSNCFLSLSVNLSLFQAVSHLVR